MNGDSYGQTIKKPLASQIKSEEIKQKLSSTGPSDEKSLLLIIKQAKDEDDSAAEGIACFKLGYVLDNHLERPLDAITQYNQALNLFPDWPEAYFNRGVANIHLSHFSEAIRDFDKVEKLLAQINKIDHSGIRSAYELLIGKLLLFRAEARLGINKPDETLIARDEILRAQIYLKFNGPEGEYWLTQIGDRLRNLHNIESKYNKRAHSIYNQKEFWFGFGLSFLILLIMWFFIIESNPVARVTSPSPKNTSKNNPVNKLDRGSPNQPTITNSENSIKK
ncbi:Tetratricopeptide repeat protein [Gimesia chilikensis]|uniref:Tetratricopeptide repeat protein n=1 Tax=Gimesia chilikensis TaxID=2605989 RepID=A0A517W704_9PLAN|nr:tetratricopeptide repeat protein [Gimesia chilikensis]QDU01025.1 Tetratricopeptide repeat protein [Gimesia chilikensis]